MDDFLKNCFFYSFIDCGQRVVDFWSPWKSLEEVVEGRLVAQVLDLDRNCRFLAFGSTWLFRAYGWNFGIEKMCKRGQVRYDYGSTVRVW